MTAKEIMEAGLYDAAVMLMDDELREELHMSREFTTEEDFLEAYMEAHEAKHGIGFII